MKRFAALSTRRPVHQEGWDLIRAPDTGREGWDGASRDTWDD